MEAANFADMENNQMGKPALNKLQIIETVKAKLKNKEFAQFFLDKNGLDQFYHFLKKLPDGSLPLSSVRKQIYECLLDLPYEDHHIKATKLNKILTSLFNNPKEYPENKQLIDQIKDKWQLLANSRQIQYNDLEDLEKDNKKLMKKKRKRTSASVDFELDRISQTQASTSWQMAHTLRTSSKWGTTSQSDLRVC